MARVLLANNAVMVSWFQLHMQLDRIITDHNDLNLLRPGDLLYGFFSIQQAIALSLKGIRCFYIWVDSTCSPFESFQVDPSLLDLTVRFVEVCTQTGQSVASSDSYFSANSTAYSVCPLSSSLAEPVQPFVLSSSITEIMRVQQHANLTIMFTDVEGFTCLNETFGDVFAFNFRRMHDKLIRSIVEQNDAGKVLKFTGDGMLAVFSCPYKAILSAFEIQKQFDAVFKQDREYKALRVRVGLHEGLVQIQNNLPYDVFGRHVNRASRVTTLAKGGQILISAALFAKVHGWMIKNNHSMCCLFHGEHLLRGIDLPEKIYQIREVCSEEEFSPNQLERLCYCSKQTISEA